MSTISASTLITTALQYTADTTGTLVFKTGATPTTALTLNADQSATFAGAVNFTTASFVAPVIIEGTTTSAALRVTQLGTGNALVVEDSTNPDSTPFVISNAGNVGIGVTPSAWLTTVPALQIGGAGGYIAAQGTAEVIRIGSNNYYNGGFKYVITGNASRYDQTSGIHAWFTAPSGTADAAITFTQAMTLHASGGLSLGNTTDPGFPTLSVTGSQNNSVEGLFTNTGTGTSASAGIRGYGNSTGFFGLRQYGTGVTATAFGQTIANYTLLFTDGASSNGLIIGALTADPVIIGTNNAERMRITSTGILGIGTSAPAGDFRMSLAGDDTIYPGLVALNNQTGTQVSATIYATSSFGWAGTRSNHPFILITNGSERFRFGAAGQLGIGGATYGTAGQVLTSGGSGAAPTWATPAGLTAGTAVSASGTSVDFTGIPSTAKRVTVILNAISTNGSSNLRFQVGSGSMSTSGYSAAMIGVTSGQGTSGTNSQGGLNGCDTYVYSQNSSYAFFGTVVWTLVSSNTWTCVATIATSQSTSIGFFGGSSPALGGALDRIRLTTANGTDSFDAGTINILYE